MKIIVTIALALTTSVCNFFEEQILQNVSYQQYSQNIWSVEQSDAESQQSNNQSTTLSGPIALFAWKDTEEDIHEG